MLTRTTYAVRPNFRYGAIQLNGLVGPGTHVSNVPAAVAEQETKFAPDGTPIGALESLEAAAERVANGTAVLDELAGLVGHGSLDRSTAKLAGTIELMARTDNNGPVAARITSMVPGTAATRSEAASMLLSMLVDVT